MHREIKFVMIPDRSSTAPAYSLWRALPSSCFPFCPHLTLTHWFALPNLMPFLSISMVPQARCVLQYSPLHSQGDAGNHPGTKLQGNPPSWGQELHPWPVLACPGRGESCGFAPEVPRQLFFPLSSVELLLLLLQPHSDLCWVKPRANSEGECKRCITRAGSVGARADLGHPTRLGCSQGVPAHAPVQVSWAISDPCASTRLSQH